MWGQHILLPLIPILIPVASGLTLLVSGLRGFLMLFMPDLSWLAMISGCFALVWSFLRTGLILRILRKPQESKALVGQLSTERGVPQAL